MLVEKFDQLGEIGERPGEPVDLVNYDDVNFTGADLGEKLLQGRAVKRRPGKCAVVIMVADQEPTFMRLALDIGFAGLALGIERVELNAW